MMKKHQSFRGVFAKDMLANKVRSHESGLINLDNHFNSGTHWTCYYNHPNEKFVEYFDSYGMEPPQEVITFLKTSKKPIVFNSNQIQSFESKSCGWYCVYFIAHREAGKSMYDVIYSFDQWPSSTNQQILIRYSMTY